VVEVDCENHIVVDDAGSTDAPSPGSEKEIADGLRFVKAFMQLEDPELRGAVIGFTERVAKEASNNSAKARELMTQALSVFG
jgi:hypothetical protein